jgi:hypothetical protein
MCRSTTPNLWFVFVALVIVPMSANAAWKSETIDGRGGDHGQWVVSATDSAGRLHVAYHDGGNTLYHARWNGSSWVRTVVDRYLDGGRVVPLGVGLDVDSAGNAHISYYDNGNYYDADGFFVAYRANLKYAKWNGSGWAKQVIASANDAGMYNSLALDSNNRPHICFYYNTEESGIGIGRLDYIRWTGTQWSREVVDDLYEPGEGGGAGEYCRIVVDSSNTPRVIYGAYTVVDFVTNQHLRYAVRNAGGGWIYEPTTSDLANWDTGLALAPNGTPHAVFFDSDDNLLRHAVRSPVGWTNSVVDAGFNAGLYNSISVDGLGVPGVAYTNENYDLVFARRTGTTWSRSTITTDTVLGVAVTYDPSNIPLVAYYVPGTGLRLARPVAPEISVEQPAGSLLKDGLHTRTLGSVAVGATGFAKTFTIKNIGNQTLNGLSIAKSGAHRADFKVSTLATTSLVAGASTTFKISFAPTAAGTRTAAIKIASNDADENPFDVNLSGTGVAP